MHSVWQPPRPARADVRATCAGSSSYAHSAEAPTSILNLRVDGATLSWNAVEADEYVIVDAFDGPPMTTHDTSVLLPSLAVGGDTSVTVAAVRDGVVVAVEGLRGGVETLENDTFDSAAVSVEEGMSLLAAMRVASTPESVQFSLPALLSSEVDGWSLYRDEMLVATVDVSQLAISDTAVLPGASYLYTVVLAAPDWEGIRNRAGSSPPFVGTPREECYEGSEMWCVPTGTTWAEPAADEVAGTAGIDEWDTITGDNLMFTLPLRVPKKRYFLVENVLNPAMSEAGTGTDDAYVWHNTFIPEAHIDAPDCYGCADVWFGGDNRDFGSEPGTKYRTMVRTRVDWNGRMIFASSDVGETIRYHRQSDGSFRENARKTGAIRLTHESVAEGARFRVRVRHEAPNPFEDYYPAIDYHWEYVMVEDGGISARGLHDGAPNYEIFYQAPHSNRRTVMYQHAHTSFFSLAPPMDQKDRSWCAPARSGGACPGYGEGHWIQ